MIFAFGIVLLFAIVLLVFCGRRHYISFGDAVFYGSIAIILIMIMTLFVGIIYTTNVGRVAEMEQEEQYLADGGGLYERQRFNEDLSRMRALRASPVWPGFLLFPSTGHLDFIDISERKVGDEIKHYRGWNYGNSTVVGDAGITHYLRDMD